MSRRSRAHRPVRTETADSGANGPPGQADSPGDEGRSAATVTRENPHNEKHGDDIEVAAEVADAPLPELTPSGGADPPPPGADPRGTATPPVVGPGTSPSVGAAEPRADAAAPRGVVSSLTGGDLAGGVAEAPVSASVSGRPPADDDSGLPPFVPDPQGVGWWIVFFIATAALAGMAVRHVTMRGKVETALRFATRDPLTGLANRRLFDETLAREVARHRRHAEPFALALVDLDDFKAVNDRRGHGGGDDVLCRVAARSPIVCGPPICRPAWAATSSRWCWPIARPTAALQVAESLRAEIEAAVGPDVTASVGVAVMPDHADEAEALVAAADAALYAAKRGGRNRAALALEKDAGVSAG